MTDKKELFEKLHDHMQCKACKSVIVLEKQNDAMREALEQIEIALDQVVEDGEKLTVHENTALQIAKAALGEVE